MPRILLIWIFSFSVCFAQEKDKAYCNVDDLPLDARITHELNQIQNPALTTGTKIASNGLYVASVALPLGFFIHGLSEKNSSTYTTSLILAGGEAVTYGLTYILKQSIARERPYQKYPPCFIMRAEEKFGSMPSGHAAGSACIATIISLRYPEWYVIAPAVAYTLFVDFSRMHLGVHYPTDLIAGTILGVGVGYAAYKIILPYEKEFFPDPAWNPQSMSLISMKIPLN